MAAYAYTAVLHEKTLKDLKGFPGMRMVSGTVNVTNYNGTTPVAITEISSKFKSNYVVMLTPIGTGAITVDPSWDSTNSTIRFTVTSTGVALADNLAAGTVGFLAVGI